MSFIRKTAAAIAIALLLQSGVHASQPKKDFIKWVDFRVSYEAMEHALEIDIKSHENRQNLRFTELLAYLGAKYGGDFSKYRKKDLDELAKKLRDGAEMSELTVKMKHYPYYLEAYSAVLSGFVGNYRVEKPNESGGTEWVEKYGLKVFSPIARGFSFSHYDDFGAGRSFGYKRKHLGHDMMGLTGTPIIAVESGIVEAAGWNRYGGWRVGIRSFDGMRYYYYAHMRKNRPFHCDLKEGGTVRAGDVIGYMGRSGYSDKENTNNIKTTHLHFGMQLIFDPSQEDGAGEIWIDTYALTKFLQKNRSETVRIPETKEFYKKYGFDDGEMADG